MKLLMLSGGNHPFDETTPILEDLLTSAGHAVDVTEDASILTSSALNDCDGLVFNTLRVGPLLLQYEQQVAITRFIQEGHGFICIHVSSQLPENWPEYHDITGGGWITRRSRHTPYGPFSVHVSRPDHPCAAGIADFEAMDEFFIECPGLPLRMGWFPGNEVFLTAQHEGEPRAIAWSRGFGQGRVLCTLLGHDARSYRPEGVGRVILNGVQWTTGGGVERLQMDG